MHLYIYILYRSCGLYSRRRVGSAAAQSLNRVPTATAAREFSSTTPLYPRLFSPGEIVMTRARAWVCVCVYEKRPGLWAVCARVLRRRGGTVGYRVASSVARYGWRDEGPSYGGGAQPTVVRRRRMYDIDTWEEALGFDGRSAGRGGCRDVAALLIAYMPVCNPVASE